MAAIIRAIPSSLRAGGGGAPCGRQCSTWRGRAASKEHWSYLPILNVVKGGGGVHQVSSSASIFRAVVSMVRHRTGSVLVSGEEGIVGIVTERDILDKLPFAVGSSRSMSVTSIMTPKAKLVTASSNYTLDKCIETMQSGSFRHLPIMEKGEVKNVISMRDIAQQILTTLSKTPMQNPPLVAELMSAKGSKGCIEIAGSATVADAVGMMQGTKTGSVLVSFDNSYGTFTERDYLTRVVVYDEAGASDISLGDVCTSSEFIKTVSPTSRITDCLALMLAGGFRHVPVAENKTPVGVISMRDVTKFFLGPDM